MAQDIRHGLEVNTLSRDLGSLQVLRQNALKACHVTLCVEDNLVLVGVGVLLDALHASLGLGDYLALVGLGLADEPLLILLRGDGVIKRLLYLLWRMGRKEVDSDN